MAYNPDFRPDPSRGVFVTGEVNQQMLDRLTSQILSLQDEGREPITAYIDSPGGVTYIGEVLLRLLWASNQDGDVRCNLITVVTSLAASAAADLLTSGDYAIAYPWSTIIFHGVRVMPDDPITIEAASFLQDSLRLSNDRYAMTIADRSVWRFVFRYVYLRDQFKSVRGKGADRKTNLKCFIELLNARVSKNGRDLLTHASKRFQRYERLILLVRNPAGGATRTADFEAESLKRIIDFELQENQGAEWNLKDGGLTRINDDFILLTEYVLSHASAPFVAQCQRWKDFFLTDADRRKIRSVPKEKREEAMIQKLKPTMQPIWLYFVALCHVLQERENVLSASDAYWLGLLDEVIGSDDLNLRMIIENPPQKRRKRRAARKRSAKV